MKVSVAVIIALVCIMGLALADYGGYSYMPYYPAGKGSGATGDYGIFMLIGFLFIILLLFGTTSQDTITLVNVTTK